MSAGYPDLHADAATRAGRHRVVFVGARPRSGPAGCAPDPTAYTKLSDVLEVLAADLCTITHVSPVQGAVPAADGSMATVTVGWLITATSKL